MGRARVDGTALTAGAPSATGATTPLTPPPEPTLPPTRYQTDFVSLDGWETKTPLGTVQTTRHDAARDGHVVELEYPGDPALSSTDRVGPVRWPVELRKREPLGFGEYRVAVELARCRDDEELVNGIFVYANDGVDRDADGIVDNSEIDIEILCGAPHLIWMTVWTDYQPAPSGARFQKRTRVLDMKSGRYRETPPGKEGTYETTPGGTVAEAMDPTFPIAGRFYELGFEWHSERVRYFLRRADVDVTLWDLTERERIPQHEARFMLNLWHSRRHWVGGAEADYPKEDGVMRVDWFRFRPHSPGAVPVQSAEPAR